MTSVSDNSSLAYVQLLLAGVMLMLASCVSQPLKTETELTEITAAEAAEETQLPAGTVLWGGVILGSSNLAESTQLEILAYPLDKRQRPMTTRDALGRFLIESEGYLETANYADGRLVTVLGELDKLVDGTIGGAKYVYPAVKAAPDKLHLWNGEGDHETPRFTFGIGINLSN
ncbi:MAG: Slp family lipoprotein [Granulosicoccus sp.]